MSTKQLRYLIRDLDELQSKIEPRVREEVEDVADDMAMTMRRSLADSGAVASGNLISSVRVTSTRERIAIRAGGKQFNAGHAPFVEFGTGSYFASAPGLSFAFQAPDNVPLAAIKRWLVQKGIPHTDQTVWNIKRNIEKYGTKAQPFFRPAIAQHRDRIPTEGGVGVEKAIQESF